jgi:hypothetical protein
MIPDMCQQYDTIQSVPITTNVVEFEYRSWRGVFDLTLCDKSLSVTCGRLVVFSEYFGFLHQ